jgi:hypothetical protein
MRLQKMSVRVWIRKTAPSVVVVKKVSRKSSSARP